MLVYLSLSFVAAFAVFHLGKHRWKTPVLFNILGSFCAWASVFCLGGASGGVGPRSSVDSEPIDLLPYANALKYLVLVVLVYGGAHWLQRAIAKWQERKGTI